MGVRRQLGLEEGLTAQWYIRMESTAEERRDASLSKGPRDHEGKLFLPERIAVRSGPLMHDNIRTCDAQRVRPPSRVLEQERL